MSTKNTSNGWLSGLRTDLVGKNAHRTWIAFVTAVITAYFAVYALFESRHDRQLQIALYERNAFITMVSSGNRGQFIGAMQNFGRIQNIEIPQYPSLFEPWTWFGDETPNKDPLWRWARYRLPFCTPRECGDEEENIRIDLRGVFWLDVKLSSVDLREADFTGAILSGANLVAAILCNANLTDVNLSYADLSNTDIHKAIFTDAHMNGVKLAHVNVSSSDLSDEQLRRVRGSSPDESGVGDRKCRTDANNR